MLVAMSLVLCLTGSLLGSLVGLLQPIFKKDLFIYFEREKLYSHTWVRGRGRGRDSILSRLHAQHGAQRGDTSHDCEIMTWAEIKSQMLNWLSHPDAPNDSFKMQVVMSFSSLKLSKEFSFMQNEIRMYNNLQGSTWSAHCLSFRWHLLPLSL